MSRTIKLNGVECAVSKSEAKEAENLRLAMSAPYNSSKYAQQRFDDWLKAASSPEMRQRRVNVGLALQLAVA